MNQPEPDQQEALENQQTPPLKVSTSNTSKPKLQLLLPISILLLGLAVSGLTRAILVNKGSDDVKVTSTTPTPSSSPGTETFTYEPTPSISPASSVARWSFDGAAWNASGTPPACDNPIDIAAPTDISKATNILYPGQFRGGNYKPHGGFLFSKATTNAVNVSLAIDGYLYRGSRYIEAGEVQTILDFVNPCGYMVRYDHLLTLTPEFQALVDATLPEAKENESVTTVFPDNPNFSKGTTIATAVGFVKTKNVSFDFGVYDLRQANSASQSPAFVSKVGQMKEMTYFGTCWLDLLPSADSALAKALPGSGTEGKTSDYCN